MNIPSYMTVIEQYFTELDLILNHYVFNGYSTLANHLKAPLGLAIVLLIVLFGISIMQGWLELSMGNVVKAALKIGFVYMLAMNWGIFSEWIVKGIEGGAGEIGGWLVNATPLPNPIPHLAGEGIDGAIQSVFIEFVKIGAWVWDKGSWHNYAPLITGMLIWGFGYAMLLVAIFEIVLAKVMLAVLFATAPLFITFTLFEKTRSFFDRWLGAIVGFSLLMIFVNAMLGLALSMAQWAIGGVYLDHALHITVVGFIPSMVVGFLGVGIILKAAQLAQSIGGTVSTSSGSELMGAAVGGFIGGSLAALRVPKKVMDTIKDSTRKIRGRGSDNKSSRFDAMKDNLSSGE